MLNLIGNIIVISLGIIGIIIGFIGIYLISLDDYDQLERKYIETKNYSKYLKNKTKYDKAEKWLRFFFIIR